MTIHEEVVTLTRIKLKNNLAKCTEKQQLFFKRMYCHLNLGLTIDQVVDQMKEDKLDWAMSQVERTLG